MKRQPTPEQKAKAEERREALRQLWAKIAEMTEEQRAQFADGEGVFSAYYNRNAADFVKELRGKQ